MPTDDPEGTATPPEWKRPDNADNRIHELLQKAGGNKNNEGVPPNEKPKP